MKNIYAVIAFACVVAYGVQAAQGQTGNTVYGTGALPSNTGSYNSAFGFDALYSSTSSSTDTAIGAWALYSTPSSGGNTATGFQTLYADTSGSGNTADGFDALNKNTSGQSNTAVGLDALNSNTTGVNNIALGSSAGVSNPATASYNIDIGNTGSSSDSGTIRIGTSSSQTSFYAAGIAGVAISSPIPVYINSNGQLGTVSSSIRFKEDVHDMADASSKLLQLRPVTYRYKEAYADGSKPIDYGLIAEEVARVYPDLVAHDASGVIQTVQYQKLTPMLLNEVQKQQKTIEMLEQRLSALEAATSSANSKTHVSAE